MKKFLKNYLVSIIFVLFNALNLWVCYVLYNDGESKITPLIFGGISLISITLILVNIIMMRKPYKYDDKK